MKKLYLKSELGFALGWIVAYVVLLSAADAISVSFGIEKSVTAPLCVVSLGYAVYIILNVKQKAK